jgi:predicted Zn finger-like uncharacterized protein
MLLTICPQCSAQFKVAPEQLNIRQGRVMCGRCRHVFNAFESLKRVADEDVPIEITDYAIVDSAYLEPSPPLVETSIDESAELVTPSELMTQDSATFTNEIPVALDISKHIARTTEFVSFSTATTTDDNDLLLPAMPEVDAVKRTSLAEDSNSNDEVNLSQNPLIRGSVPTQKRASRLWGWLAGLAAIGLIAQAIYFFRSDIVQHYPELRPHMLRACETLQCQIPWGRLADAIKIESSDLIEPPGKPGRILLLATIANRATTKHDFPHVEVKLMDAANMVLASRIFTPTEYLARIPNADEGMAANTELYVNLQLELVGKTTASGYGLRAFYP